ncbi:MAG: single-stranded-DNA-specific exonuclease RecJ [Candidatus Latescibacteria bacterium]|nr:single-stranded-DNA-specific exonuclease RecJ [Candidatus Latescibacterota bacterium]
MAHRWMLSEPSAHREALMALINVPGVIAQILINRGVLTFDDARRFLKPRLDDLHDPFLMQDMDKAVDRMATALQRHEPVMVFGDYDVDGTTSTALLYLVLRGLSDRVSFYIPDRLQEGYGLSERGIDEAERRGSSLIIAVDCGITATREIDLARTAGIDVIVVDHHQPGDRLPDALALLNPKRPGCPYPFKDLCGVGLAYKVAQALAARLDLPQEIVETHLDLVALGTAADIVPLQGENRVLVKHGLEELQYSQKPGLRALITAAGLSDKELSTSQVVFGLAPRLNAAGRMGDASRGVRLMITTDADEAARLAEELNAENRRRQQQDELVFFEARTLVEQDACLREAKGLVLASDRWHPGVIGIVASRMVEAFCRPAVMIAVEGQVGRGSARTMGDFHLYDALKACSDLLVRFGGHRHAAGLTIRADRIDALRERFNDVVSERTTPADFIPRLPIDAEIAFQEIDARLIKLLKMLSPFGPDNRQPVLVARDLTLASVPSIIGSDRTHLKFRVEQHGRTLEAIGFGMASCAEQLRSQPQGLQLAFTLEENTWNGTTSFQLRVKDIKTGTDA